MNNQIDVIAAKRLAKAIGLISSHSPPVLCSPFVKNCQPTRTKTRKFNLKDLQILENKLKADRMKSASRSTKKHQKQKSLRKNSQRDQFLSTDENSLLFNSTQRQLRKQQMDNIYSRWINGEILKSMEKDKKNRARILEEVSTELIQASNQNSYLDQSLRIRNNFNRSLFMQPAKSERLPKSDSFDRLKVSLQMSKVGETVSVPKSVSGEKGKSSTKLRMRGNRFQLSYNF